MNYAIILSGGIGTRMNIEDFPKQYLKVEDKPILLYTVETTESSVEIDKIIIVVADEWKEQVISWMKEYHITKFLDVAKPGETRQESILNALEVCATYSKNDDDNVIIMDGVRALMTSQLISNCVKQLDEHEGCMPVIPVNDTIYQSNDCKKIDNLLDRSILWAGQNPEGYKLKRYLEINRDMPKEKLALIRGSSEIGFYYGMDICLFPGEDTNFKITTPADLSRFKTIVAAKRK